MLYKEDWEKVKNKSREYWARENHERPLLNIQVPKDGYTPKKIHKLKKIIDQWLDVEYIIESSREQFAATYFAAESYPVINPNLGPDIFGAILGCDLEFGETTSWSNHIIHDWDNHHKFEFDKSNKWWEKIYNMTKEIVEDGKDSYLVGITDLHPGADGLVSLRGPGNLCYDLIDKPDAVKQANFQIFEVFKLVYEELYALTTKYQNGTTNWMSIWHPERWYVTSSDFICMISEGMFDEFILPELIEEINWLDASIFHLDGPDALKHLDIILQIPNLKGVQWVYGAGQPSASHWIPILKKIQEADKLIQVNIQAEELEILMENLNPEGVHFNVSGCKNEEEANTLIKIAEKFNRRYY